MSSIGAIVRSVGERTLGLCTKSLLSHLPEDNVLNVSNVFPFLDALKLCYKLALDRNFDWVILIDADMIMVKDWLSIITPKLNATKEDDRIWEITFRLKDAIEERNIDAIHIVKGEYVKDLLESALKISDGLKPEGAIRDDMMNRTKKKRTIFKDVIAYHGYEQYYKDIFNRFYNRACRDSQYAQKVGLFKNLTSLDKKVAKEGWIYGIKSNNLKSLDYNEKVDCKKLIDVQEKSHIRYSLSTFYKRVEK